MAKPLEGSLPPLSQLRNLLVFELAFYFAYRYGMAFPQDHPAPFWFPDSVLLCALLLTPRKTWWMYVAGPLPIRLLLFVPTGMPSWFLAACFVNDSLKALLAAWLLTRDSETANWFESPREFSRYLLAAVLLAPSLSAFGGAAAGVAARGADFWSAWQGWFLGNSLANLVLTPAALCLVRDFHKLGRSTPGRRFEAGLLAAGMIVSAYCAFYLERSTPRFHPFLLCLPVPFVLWGAFRFGPLGTCGALSIVSALAVVGKLAGRGPFSTYSAGSSIFEIQLFMCTLAIPFLFLSVLIRERQNAQETLNQLTRRLALVREAERHRIGQELHDDLGQRVLVLSWRLSGLAQQFEREPALASELDKLRVQATDISKDVVRVSHELRPVALASAGLSFALESMCEQATSANGVAVSFARRDEPSQALDDLDGGRGRSGGLADGVELSLYRVAQEALRNALMHSGSASVSIELRASTTGLDLTVTDDGCGFVAGSPSAVTGLGLAGMAERMKNAGGKLRIVSIQGRGTTVVASVPGVPSPTPNTSGTV